MMMSSDPSAGAKTLGRHISNAFGLRISSDFLIEELPQASPGDDADIDVEILKCEGIRDTTSPLQPLRVEFRTENGPAIDYLHWHDVGSFRICGSDRIEYDMHPDMGLDVVTLPLLGTVMALLLHRRGLLVLHGSAVQIGDEAMVFLGDKGAGKSTTAASLVAAGRRILTDDIVALERTPEGIRLLPGYGQIKLTQMATDAIQLPASRVMDQPFEGFSKHRHVLDDGFDPSPLTVSDIHVLERGAVLQIDPLAGASGLTSIMRFAYLTRFGSKLFAGEEARFLLDWCADVTREIRVNRLEVPSTIEGLTGLGRFLDASLSPSGSPR